MEGVEVLVGLGLSGRQARVYLATFKLGRKNMVRGISNLLKLIEQKIANKCKLNRFIAKRSVWACSCGYSIPEEDAVLSGDAWSSQVVHFQCPRCGKVKAQFVNHEHGR